MPKHAAAIFLFMAASVAAEPYIPPWSEFTNNFATDLAPIITLFGEQVTKQFLSESTSFLDNIIFGVAPLGILTAVVSVIRVYGNASLKSFIGRSQEAHGVAEAELCSSTSEDVCELWSNGGICRVFGRPRILEFLYTGGRGQFYPVLKISSNGEMIYQPPTCGIELPRTYLTQEPVPNDQSNNTQGSSSGGTKWREVNPVTFPVLETEQGLRKIRERFAPYPNLSLNIGIRMVPKWMLVAVAMFGASLQLSYFLFATWVTFYNSEWYEDQGEPPQTWSFWMASLGTALMVLGMILCAMMIERKSCERWFRRVATEDDHAKEFMFWLQPGGQRVGDQLFNAFAYWEEKNEYVTSWRVDSKAYRRDPDFIRKPLVILWIAISCTTIGFILQFIGLRGIHGSIALYQLASTLIMSTVRALLRGRRLDPSQNMLRPLRQEVEGHELDWMALHLDLDDIPANRPSGSDRGKC
jgi:hypothetical protein